MKYIAIIHKDADSAYGVTLPDFPGCFSAADSLDEIPAAVQEAVELWAEGEEVEPPVPSGFDAVAGSDAAQGVLLIWWISILTFLIKMWCRSTFQCPCICVIVSTGRPRCTA